MQQVQKYPPHSKTTVKGHFKAIKKALKHAQIISPSINNTTSTASSKPTIIKKYDSDDDHPNTTNPSNTTPDTSSPESLPTQLPTTTPNDNALANDMVEQLINPSKRTNYVYADCKHIARQMYTDQYGPVLIPSASDIKYVMVLYEFDSNLI